MANKVEQKLEIYSLQLQNWNHKPETIKTHLKVLRRLIIHTGATNFDQLAYDDLADFVEAAPSVKVAYQYRSSLRKFFTWAADAGHTKTNPALLLIADNAKVTPARHRIRTGPYVSGPLPAKPPAKWEKLISDWVQHLFISGYSSGTITKYRTHLTRLGFSYMHQSPEQLTLGDLTAWLATLQIQAGSIKGYRTALVSFYRFLVEIELIVKSPAEKIPKPKITVPPPKPISETSLALAIKTADPDARLAILLGAEIGLRRSEIASLHTSALRRTDTGFELAITGKGRKTRILPIPAPLATEIKTRPTGFVFPSERSATGHICNSALGKKITKYLGENETPHMLRHRFATRAYEITTDLATTQKLLGHSRPETTMGYTQIQNSKLRNAVEQLANQTTRKSTR